MIKKKIDSVIDKLGDKSIKVEDVPVVQCSDVSRQPKNDVEISHQLQNKSSSFAAGPKMKAARKRAANTILAAVNNKSSRNSLPENLQELHPKEEKKSCDKCKLVDDCRRILKKKCKSLEEENYMIKEEHMKIRSKYNALKAKYKSLKRKVKSEGIESDFIKIGNSTLVEKHKLNMCRLSCVSKSVSDLLDVVFGREILANSSMKGTRGASKPPLPENELNDVMSFTCEKFSVDVGTVRAAVRQKLNVAHKSRATQ
ncbi:hypothetical protein AVEN_119211-1 [Araneus ventricosus]|uniref:BEN domain-containing protein n=1 Tax=Araneus ventricosus TaxID=182803 RepID=A0A4Y2NXJ0_ARAVE|nr:hypothetical protein AVEN_119211-1 [Araneus ventricosus]